MGRGQDAAVARLEGDVVEGAGSGGHLDDGVVRDDAAVEEADGAVVAGRRHDLGGGRLRRHGVDGALVEQVVKRLAPGPIRYPHRPLFQIDTNQRLMKPCKTHLIACGKYT